MTERSRASVVRDATSFIVGPSRLGWDGNALEIDLDEITFPLPGRIRGTICLHPSALNLQPFALDATRRHWWWPMTPIARVEVKLQRPGLGWRGTAYFDGNWGAEPLEDGFSQWTWSRADLGRQSIVLYDAKRRDGSTLGLTLGFDSSGRVRQLEQPRLAHLPKAPIWRMARPTRADSPEAAIVKATFEDTPFYARSLLETRLFGQSAMAIHESLSLDRFALPIVQAMLPFRMPRRSLA